MKKIRDGYGTEELRWAAVCENDEEADGVFYYAVKSTGIYCRPSCSSRQPLRENVDFYDSVGAVELAGFRACKRCRPDEGSLQDEYVRKVAEACRVMEVAEEAPSLDELARGVGLAKFHFHRIFVRLTGVTPKAYARGLRAGRLRDELEGGGSVTGAIYEAGYGSSGRFYEESTAVLGMKAGSYRRGGMGETICFALGECSLGVILVASSVKGICALSLGDDPEVLVEELEERFSEAELIGGDDEYEELVARVVGLIEVSGVGWDLPLDVRGTAFQMRVWKALQDVPAGQTYSYTELAEKIGSVKSVRAVASACAANKIAVAIPCHRVVRKTGELSGYRWGVERKEALLEREKEIS